MDSNLQYPQLSEAVASHPSSCSEISIALVNKQIIGIDKLDERFKEIQSLDLSRNLIRSLSRLRQFSSLKVLSLAHNSIDTMQDLPALPLLESLNLEGNRITEHPSYNRLVLDTYPNLKTLDGKPVKEPILLNEEKAGKLEILMKNLRIKKELIEKRKLVQNYPVDIKKFLKGVEIHWTKNLLAKINKCLDFKIQNAVKKGYSKGEAYKECLDRQNQFIKKLHGQCEALTQECVFLGRKPLSDANCFEKENVELVKTKEINSQYQQRLEVALARNALLEEQIRLLTEQKAVDLSLSHVHSQRLDQIAQHFKDKFVLKRIFAKLKAGTSKNKKIHQFSRKVEAKRTWKVFTQTVAGWKSVSIAGAFYRRNCMKRALWAMRRISVDIENSLAKYLSNSKRTSKLRNIFKCWKVFSKRRFHERQMSEFIKSQQCKYTMLSTLYRWKQGFLEQTMLKLRKTERLYLDLEEKQASLSSDMKKISSKCMMLEEEIEENREEREHLIQENTELAHENEELKRNLEDTESLKTKFEETVLEQDYNLNTLNNLCEKLQGELNSSDKFIENLEHQLSSLHKEKAFADEEIRYLRDRQYLTSRPNSVVMKNSTDSVPGTTPRISVEELPKDNFNMRQNLSSLKKEKEQLKREIENRMRKIRNSVTPII